MCFYFKKKYHQVFIFSLFSCEVYQTSIVVDDLPNQSTDESLPTILTLKLIATHRKSELGYQPSSLKLYSFILTIYVLLVIIVTNQAETNKAQLEHGGYVLAPVGTPIPMELPILKTSPFRWRFYFFRSLLWLF